jgi:hypothetical protein
MTNEQAAAYFALGIFFVFVVVVAFSLVIAVLWVYEWIRKRF